MRKSENNVKTYYYGIYKNALGMLGDAATGGLASGVGSFVSGLFGGGGGIDYHDQKN